MRYDQLATFTTFGDEVYKNGKITREKVQKEYYVSERRFDMDTSKRLFDDIQVDGIVLIVNQESPDFDEVTYKNTDWKILRVERYKRRKTAYVLGAKS